jgi:hypothetical protein
MHNLYTIVSSKKNKNMKEYQILVSGYRNGYLTTELIKIDGLSIEDAAFNAEQKSSLDGATARI